MNAGHYLPLAVLLTCVLAGKSYAAGPAPSKTPAHAIAANAVPPTTGLEEHIKIRQLIDRQAQAWEKQDFSIAAADWLPTAELVSPGGRMTTSQLPAVIKEYFKHFRDVHVAVKNVFTSADESKVAIEWDWDVTRIRDGVRQVTHDAIIVDLRGEKIASWREYFDLGNSIDSQP
jgi:ketosteroid isomerase-like protein